MSTVTDPFRQRLAARAVEAQVRRQREIAAAGPLSPQPDSACGAGVKPRCSWSLTRALAVILIVAFIALASFGKGRSLVAHWFRSLSDTRPHLLSSKPANSDAFASREGTITAKLRLTSGRLDPSTVNADSVRLVRSSDGQRVAAAIELGRSGDAILISPETALDPSTGYTLIASDCVRDTSNVAIVPFSISFTTRPPADPSIRFEKVALPTARGAGFTSVVMGPDHRLYAGTDEGLIYRFDIAPDWTLGSPHIINSLQRLSGGPRLLIGFCFDPKSTPQNPIVWASHGFLAFKDAPDFSGRITRLSGPNLENAQDVIVNLPRSYKDHLNLQPVVGPDGAIYFSQGSNSAYGAPDEEWGMRPEHLLNAAILRLDPTKLPATLPLNVKTIDAGGTYDPRATGAPLTIYAEGLRLAYDLCWASNGQLYAPANGSSAGGNTPAGNSAPQLENIPENEDDWLFRIVSGKYYGHPNPQQGHYVLNGGNPTAGEDFAEVPQYSVGTQPDSNWQPAIYDFGVHISPNGIVQYSGNVFGGKLKDRLLVCRYNNGGDLLVITLDSAGNVASADSGFVGMGGFTNPLDVTEDRSTGNLYVAEYGARKLTLLRPASPH
jgi:glucose/arabinose dehydrogenase